MRRLAVVLALFALGLGLRRDRVAVLGPAALITADLAYASWINPMGAGDRQIGHVACAALAVLAGVGGALLYVRAPARLRWPLLAGFVALACAMVLRLAPQARADGYAASELVGSARFSREARSVSGNAPSSTPRKSSACWRCIGVT